MKFRSEIFDTYWKFAAARQEIFFNRIKNSPPPWTTDEILKKYKFCNAYRASDRVSQYLIKNVIYQGSQNEEEVLFRILLFKFFNKIETWEYLESNLGTIQLFNFDLELYSNLLQSAMDAGQVIYTGAYMMSGTKDFGYNKKHQNHLALISQMMLKDRIVDRLLKAKSLKEVFQIIGSYPLVGNFLAYQLATDINYSEIIDFDENSFTMPGPGAERGINKCFIDTGGKSNADIIHWMVQNQEQEFKRLGINFQSLWGRPLQAIDCQNLFCEVDKYCRVAVPELKSNRKRMKSRFSPISHPIEYFYPPKWGINDKVKVTLAQRLPSVEASVTPSREYENKKQRGRKSKVQQLEDNGYQQLSLDYQITDNLLTSHQEIKDNVQENLEPRLPIQEQLKQKPIDSQSKKKRGRKPKFQQPEDENFQQLSLNLGW